MGILTEANKRLLNYYTMIVTTLKKIVGLSLVITMAGFLFVPTLEPMFAQAVTDSVIITLNVTSGITIDSPADASMSTALGVSQNTAVATTTWNVKTNNALGYTLALSASTNPAMQQSATATITDFNVGVPMTWVATSSNAYFGYSAFGTDTSTGTWGTGAVCSTGANAHAISTTLKYRGLSTSPGTTVSTRAATTTPSGINTTVCYAVEQNGFYIPSGTYTATVTATALAL